CLLHLSLLFLLFTRPLPRSTLFPYTTLFRSGRSSRRRTGSTHASLAPSAPRGTSSPTTWCSRRCSCFVRVYCALWGLCCASPARSEEHTSELQSRENLVCRLLLEKKNDTTLF